MGLFATNWWWMFLIVLIVVWLKLRKNKPKAVARQKQISIRGTKILSPIDKNTPLPCLLSEGIHFGPDYKNKTAPDLPHPGNCRCRAIDVFERSEEIFVKKRHKKPKQYDTDLGLLSESEARYYKYRLIMNHPQATEKQKSDYSLLAQRIEVDPEFKAKVDQMLESIRADSEDQRQTQG